MPDPIRATAMGSYLFLATAMLIVGTSVVASKIVVDTMPIYTASALRFLVAGLVMLAILRRTGGIPRLPLRMHLIVAAQSLAGLVMFNVLLLLGLDLTTAIAATLPMATLVTIYGFVLFLPFAATDISDFHPGDIPPSGWIAICYLAVVVTVIAFALWFHGLQHVPASTAGAFTGMMPVGTILATALFLDEPITWLHGLGVAIVMVGIVLVTRGIRPARHATPPASTASVTTYPNKTPSSM